MATPPPFEIDESSRYEVSIATDKGDIVLELDPELAPNTVNNFVALARRGFYDNLTFHRVVPEFVIQGGDPEGSGRGGPGYRFADELGVAREHGYPRGTVAMANAGPNTNGSQFFIVTTGAAPWLDGKHTVFGTVVDGMDVVDAIADVSLRGESPVETVFVETVTVG